MRDGVAIVNAAFMMAQRGKCDKNYFDIVCGHHFPYTTATQGGVIMFNSLARSQRARGLLGTTRFVVLSNFLRTGIVGFLDGRPGHAASLDEIVDFYFATAVRAFAEDIDLLQHYYKGAAKPAKGAFLQYLIERASWLEWSA